MPITLFFCSLIFKLFQSRGRPEHCGVGLKMERFRDISNQSISWSKRRKGFTASLKRGQLLLFISVIKHFKEKITRYMAAWLLILSFVFYWKNINNLDDWFWQFKEPETNKCREYRRLKEKNHIFGFLVVPKKQNSLLPTVHIFSSSRLYIFLKRFSLRIFNNCVPYTLLTSR